MISCLFTTLSRFKVAWFESKSASYTHNVIHITNNNICKNSFLSFSVKTKIVKAKSKEFDLVSFS